MAMDGVFIHYLVKELNDELQNTKINRIFQMSTLDILLEMRTTKGNVSLLISSSLDNPRIYLTTKKYIYPNTALNFCMVLRKYIERGVITSITQVENDRIILINIQSFSELSDLKTYHLVFEIMGRNSNIILIDDEYTIIDAIRKLPPQKDTDRIILPHATYSFPKPNKLINPFTIHQIYPNEEYMGCGKEIMQEANYTSTNIHSLLPVTPNPVYFDGSKKNTFYAFDLQSIEGKRKFFSSISLLLDDYYNLEKPIEEEEIKKLLKVVSQAKSHLLQKIDNVTTDLKIAEENKVYTDYGKLLQSSLYLVTKGMIKITLEDFYHDSKLITIELNPLLTPSDNLKKIFQKAKKAATGCEILKTQLQKFEIELNRLNELEEDIKLSQKEDMPDIQRILIDEGYLTKTNKYHKKNKAPHISTYIIPGYIIYVGKNSLQNNYIAHTLARNDDLWFHVKDVPSSHVLLRKDGETTWNEKSIRIASNICSCFSKAKLSQSVPVDYTYVKYLKKIPGIPGYHVTYTNQKTIYIDPNPDDFKEYLKKEKS